MTHLLCFGYGYSAKALAKLLRPEGWRITGTCRNAGECRGAWSVKV